MPPAAGFDQVIDADGCLVLPGLINMHQHHWYTLFKGLADGYLLEDWVTQFLLPVSRHLGEEVNNPSAIEAEHNQGTLRGHPKSQASVAFRPNDRGLSLGHCTALSAARPR